MKLLFAEMNSSSSVVALDLPVIEDKGGLPIEAFAKAQEKFRNVDWRDLKADPAPNQNTALNTVEENLKGFQAAGKQNLEDSSTKNTIMKILEHGSIESAKEETGDSVSLQKARNENLDSIPIEALAKVQEMFSNMDWLDPNADVALNMLQITASNMIQEKLENALATVKERKNASSSQSSRTGIIDIAPPESARKQKLKAEEASTSNALEYDIISSRLRSLKVKPIASSESFMDTNSLGKKRDSGEFQSSLQSQISSPGTPHSSLSNPASFSNSFQGLSSPLSKYHSAPSSLGITALLHDDGGSKNKVGAHVVTLSPRSALSASFPHLCNPVPPNFFSGVLPSELSSPVPTNSLTKVLVAASASPSPPALKPPPPPPPPLPPNSSTSALMKESPNTLLKTAAELSAHSLSYSKELNSLSKSNTETPVQNRAASASVPPPVPPPLPKTAPSSCPVAPELQKQSSAIGSSSNAPSPLPVHSEPEACAALFSALPPPPLPSTASSSMETVSATLKYSSSSSNLCPPSIPERVSSPGLISLINSSNNSKSSIPYPPPPPSHNQDPGPVSSPAVKMSDLLRPPPPPPPPLPPASCSSSTPSSHMESLSAVPPTMPPSSGTSSSSGAISSNVPEKSSVTAIRPPPPPPPPLNSSSSLNHAASSGPTPAPPPPPSFPPNKSTSKLSQHGPPVPPPLAPFSNATSQNHSASGPGNIPPTPAPPMGSKGKLLLRSAPKNQSQTKKSSLKPYHWLKLTRAMQGSLWAETQKPEEAST